MECAHLTKVTSCSPSTARPINMEVLQTILYLLKMGILLSTTVFREQNHSFQKLSRSKNAMRHAFTVKDQLIRIALLVGQERDSTSLEHTQVRKIPTLMELVKPFVKTLSTWQWHLAQKKSLIHKHFGRRMADGSVKTVTTLVMTVLVLWKLIATFADTLIPYTNPQESLEKTEKIFRLKKNQKNSQTSLRMMMKLKVRLE